MTCKDLGGACDEKFSANTFEEIGELSQNHGMEMFQKGDEPHKKAMDDMRKLVQNPADMKKWFEGKRAEFDALAED